MSGRKRLLPFNFQDVNNLHDQIKNLSVEDKKLVYYSVLSVICKKEDSNDYFNSAYLLSPAGEIKGKYDKVHLVPYGEYVPLRNIFPFIKKLTAGIGDFSTGAGYYPLSLG